MTNDLSFTGGSPRAYTEINLGGGGRQNMREAQTFYKFSLLLDVQCDSSEI